MECLSGRGRDRPKSQGRSGVQALEPKGSRSAERDPNSPRPAIGQERLNDGDAALIQRPQPFGTTSVSGSTKEPLITSDRNRGFATLMSATLARVRIGGGSGRVVGIGARNLFQPPGSDIHHLPMMKTRPVLLFPGIPSRAVEFNRLGILEGGAHFLGDVLVIEARESPPLPSHHPLVRGDFFRLGRRGWPWAALLEGS